MNSISKTTNLAKEKEKILDDIENCKKEISRLPNGYITKAFTGYSTSCFYRCRYVGNNDYTVKYIGKEGTPAVIALEKQIERRRYLKKVILIEFEENLKAIEKELKKYLNPNKTRKNLKTSTPQPLAKADVFNELKIELTNIYKKK